MRVEAEQGGIRPTFQVSGKGQLLTGEQGITLTPSWGLAWNLETPDQLPPGSQGPLAVPPSLSPSPLSLTDTQPSLVLWHVMHFRGRCVSLPSPPVLCPPSAASPSFFVQENLVTSQTSGVYLWWLVGGGHRGAMPGAS